MVSFAVPSLANSAVTLMPPCPAFHLPTIRSWGLERKQAERLRSKPAITRFIFMFISRRFQGKNGAADVSTRAETLKTATKRSESPNAYVDAACRWCVGAARVRYGMATAADDARAPHFGRVAIHLA